MRHVSLGIILFLCSLCVAEPVTLDNPLYAEVFVPSSGTRPTKLTGQLIWYDNDQFALKVGREDRTLQWSDITPTSAFVLRQRLIDKSSAEQWLALGEWGWRLGAKEQAKVALLQAVRLDPGLKTRADVIMTDSPSSSTETSPTTTPAGELIRTGDDLTPVPQPTRKKGAKVDRIQYTPATAEQTAAAMKRIRDQQQQIEQRLGLNLTEFETDHFIVFTDWDPREHDFLRKNLEEAYRVVSRQFDMSPKDNIFVGKLPVYMFARFSDFSRFAQMIDTFAVSRQVAGYYRGHEDGQGHLVMWKPDGSLTGSMDIKEAERLWGYVLVHEFTHAFLARYRTNEFIPRWLNEGIAEVIASSVFPYPEKYRTAKLFAQNRVDVMPLFDDEVMPGGHLYPVMQTMVELLIKTNRKKFIALIDDIKDGIEPEQALRTHYKVGYVEFVEVWREWASKQNVR